MIALLLRLYPARWRARYGDEFAALLAERPIGPFDVADVLLGALDAHLHLRGLGAASEHRKGFAMTLRLGGYAAILGGILWFAGFLANTLDGSDDAWPTSGIIVAGTILLLVGMAGLSAFQARSHPALTWAAFMVPALGAVATIAGLIGLGVAENGRILGFDAWAVGMLGLITLLAGSALFALASWRTGGLSRLGTAFLCVAGLLTIPVLIGVLGTWPWEPVTSVLMFAMLLSFTGGWLLVGVAAVRADRPMLAAAGGA